MDEQAKWLWGIGTTVASAALSGLVAILVCRINNNVAREKIRADMLTQSTKTYNELISLERIKWINSLREAMVELMTKLYLLIDAVVHPSESARDLKADCSYEILRLVFAIKLCLDAGDENHKVVMGKIDSVVIELESFVNSNGMKPEYTLICKNVSLLAESFQQLLKHEWERVKQEVKPG